MIGESVRSQWNVEHETEKKERWIWNLRKIQYRGIRIVRHDSYIYLSALWEDFISYSRDLHNCLIRWEDRTSVVSFETAALRVVNNRLRNTRLFELERLWLSPRHQTCVELVLHSGRRSGDAISQDYFVDYDTRIQFTEHRRRYQYIYSYNTTTSDIWWIPNRHWGITEDRESVITPTKLPTGCH